MAEQAAQNWDTLPSGTEERNRGDQDPTTFGQPISLASPSPETKPISLGPGPVPVSEDIATKRAHRAYYALGGLLSKGWDDYHEAISQGFEKDIRTESANELHQKQLQDSYKSVLEATKLSVPERSQAVMDAVNSVPRINANSVFEDYFASKYVDNLYSEAGFNYSPFSSQFADDVASNPTQIRKITEIGKDILSKRSYLEKKLDDVQEKAKNQSWFGYGVNIASDLFTLGLYGEIRPRTYGKGPILAGLGTAEEKIWEPILNLPRDEFVAWVDKNMDHLAATDPQMAARFLQAGIGRSTEETTFDNLMTGINVGSFFPLSRAINATKSLVKSSEVLGSKDIAVTNAAAIGNLQEAAIKDSAISMVAKVNNLSEVTKEGLETLPSGLQLHIVDEAAANPGNYGTEIKNRLQQYIDGIREPLMNALLEHQRVNRIPAITAAEDVMRIAAEETKKRFPGMNSRILNMIYRAEPLSNTHWFDMIIGSNTGEYLKYESWAKGVKKTLQLGDSAVIENGGAGVGYYIRYPVPIKLTDEGIRDLIVPTGERIDLMENFLNAYIGKARTPEETVTSLSALANRKIAQYGPSDFLDIFREAMKPIQNMQPSIFHPTRSRERWDQLKRLLVDGQTMRNPDDPTKQGYFFKSPAEMEYYYRRNFGRSPDVDEVMAYNAFKTVNEMDRMLRIVSTYRDKANYGVQKHQIQLADKPSPVFEGTRLAEFPGGKDENIALVWSDGYSKIQTLGRGLQGKNLERLVENVKSGKATVIELWNQYHKPLAGWSNITDDHHIRYVYTEQGVKSDPITWSEQVPRQGGGHLQNEYPFYVSSAHVGFDPQSKVFHYSHDDTLTVARTSREAQELATHFDNARAHLEKDDKAAAKKYLIDNNVPVDPDEFISHYYPTKNKLTGRIETRLSVKEPVRVRPANRMLGDIDNSIEARYPPNMFKDGTKGGSMASNSSIQFTGQRDVYELHEVRDTGTKANPYFDLQPAKWVDPISMMNRAGDRIINSLFMDDVKAYEVQRWLKNAENYFKDGKDIWYYPWGIFNAPEGEFKAGVPKELKNRLMDDWYKIRQFTGITGEYAALIDETAQKMANMVYDTAGPAASRLVPTWGVGRAITSIPQKLRSFVFHPKLGMFNPAMFLVHAFTYVNTAAVAGIGAASKGATASMLHLWSTFDKSPEMLKYLDGIAQKFGWRPGEWTEARQMLLNSGMKNFEGEYALKDSLYGANIAKGAGEKFLDMGQMFFRGGARSVRVGSYYTAYKEFRDGGGGAFKWAGKATEAISRDEAGLILQRADLLAHNMGRASSSIMQKGMLSFGSQFAGYNYRLLEMITGKRLTPSERMRLFGTYAVLYGIPATTGLFGMSDFIRKQLMDSSPGEGYVVGKNFTESFFIEGLLATAMASFTSKDWNPEKGIYYNPGEKYGAHDLGLMQKFLSTDATFLDTFGGAAYSQFKDIWEAKNPVMHWMGNWVRGDGDYKFTWDDLIQPASTVASANALIRFAEAFHAGRYLSRRGELLEQNIGTMDAIFRLATGMTSRQQADAWIKAQMIKNEADNWKKIEQEARIHLHRAFRARRDNDPDTALSEERNARTVLIRNGYPESKTGPFFSKSLNEDQDLIHRLNIDWIKAPPAGQEMNRQNMWRGQMQREQGTK